MLMTFSFANYRSYRDEQSLSMVATDESAADRIITIRHDGQSLKLLRVAALFGGNASGKTSALMALDLLMQLVTRSATEVNPRAEIPVEPFLLDDTSEQRPTRLSVTFFHDNAIYEYSVSATRKKISSEILSTFSKSRQVMLFKRLSGKPIVFGARLKGAKRDIEKLTRPNSLYLSSAAQFNHEQLTSIYQWFADRPHMLGLGDDPFAAEEYTVSRLVDTPLILERINSDIQSADFGIVGVSAESKEVTIDDADFLATLDDVTRDQLIKHLKRRAKNGREQLVRAVLLHRKHSGESRAFSLNSESSGTRKMLATLGPWHDTIINNRLLLVDELTASLHPLLVRHMINLFYQSSRTHSTSQLMFTTHEPSILDSGVLDRSQIWMCDKSDNGGSRLSPLLRYKVRSDESLQAGYLAGRYGGVPILP